jgi:hypothetical protein
MKYQRYYKIVNNIGSRLVSTFAKHELRNVYMKNSKRFKIDNGFCYKDLNIAIKANEGIYNYELWEVRCSEGVYQPRFATFPNNLNRKIANKRLSSLRHCHKLPGKRITIPGKYPFLSDQVTGAFYCYDIVLIRRVY